MAETYVFDSYAFLKVFQKEAGYEKVVGLLRDISASGGRALMSAINYGEIIYIIKRAFGDQKKIECLGAIERLGVEILPVPNELIFRAAEYKAEFGMSYADCFAFASAVENRAAVVTGDREFGRVEGRVAIVWV